MNLNNRFRDAMTNSLELVERAALGDKLGPFRLVAPHEKRPARWVRMLKSLTVVRVTAQ
jgi:hypothetical protein